MQVHRIVLCVTDNENVGAAGIKRILENVDYVYPQVVSLESCEIGEWSDDHPLNKRDTFLSTFENLFRRPDEQQ